MSLQVLYSDRIEDLAERLKNELIESRVGGGADPFSFTQIVVPNANIAKWLQIRLFSKEKILCAGIKFPFIEQRFVELMRANLSPRENGAFELLPDHAYANAIMRILLTDGKCAKMSQEDVASLSPFKSYFLGEGGDPSSLSRKQSLMAWQLADKLASLMDQYEVRCPEIVESWLGRGEPLRKPKLGSAEAGEAAVARALWGGKGLFRDGGDRLSLRQLFDKVKDSDPVGHGEKLFFFGLSTLTLLQARILAWLSKKHDVVFYHFNPCREYWGDIETSKERRKVLFGREACKGATETCDNFNWKIGDKSVENPLLDKFGIAGRETLRLLVDLEESGLDMEWKYVGGGGTPVRGSVLARMQDSICRRTSDVERVPQDASVQIVGTPGIRREVEMVYNSILGSVFRPVGVVGERPWPECTFSDIAVLVPDMKTYRPMIESVFGARGQVPYGLVDSSASEESMYLAGFLSLMDLAREGLNRDTLFTVLGNACVQRALGFTLGDVDRWRRLTGEISAFDGFERKGDGDFFGWALRLEKMRNAFVASGYADESYMKFSEVVELLHRRLSSSVFDGGRPRLLPCTPYGSDAMGDGRSDNWAAILGELCDDFLAVEEDDQLEAGIRRKVKNTLWSLRDISGDFPFELPVAAVGHFVGGVPCRRGGYLTHGVTIARLRPMRPVPFRQVYILGMGAGGFPGKSDPSPLDIRGTGWRLGDVSQPNVNRFLFLETLMSVRDRLVISYQGRDVQKDAELFPSSAVREVEGFLGGAVLSDDGGFREFKDYPLLERGEADRDVGDTPVCDIVWRADDPFAGILPTYSAAARRLASAIRSIGESSVAPVGGEVVFDDALDAKFIANFVANPFRAIMRGAYGVAVEGYREDNLDRYHPLDIPDGPETWSLQREIVERLADVGEANRSEVLDAILAERQAGGKVATGFLGDFALSRFREPLERIGGVVDFVNKFRAAAEGELVFCNLKDRPYPAKNALEPVARFLLKTASLADGRACGFTVGAVDFEHASFCEWHWECTPDGARKLLCNIESSAKSYMGGCFGRGAFGKIPDFQYEKFCSALACVRKAEEDVSELFENVVRRMSGVADWHGGGGFDNSLVVEKTLERYLGVVDARVLGKMYDDYLSFFIGEGEAPE